MELNNEQMSKLKGELKKNSEEEKKRLWCRTKKKNNCLMFNVEKIPTASIMQWSMTPMVSQITREKYIRLKKQYLKPIWIMMRLTMPRPRKEIPEIIMIRIWGKNILMVFWSVLFTQFDKEKKGSIKDKEKKLKMPRDNLQLKNSWSLCLPNKTIFS